MEPCLDNMADESEDNQRGRRHERRSADSTLSTLQLNPKYSDTDIDWLHPRLVYCSEYSAATNRRFLDISVSFTPLAPYYNREHHGRRTADSCSVDEEDE